MTRPRGAGVLAAVLVGAVGCASDDLGSTAPGAAAAGSAGVQAGAGVGAPIPVAGGASPGGAAAGSSAGVGGAAEAGAAAEPSANAGARAEAGAGGEPVAGAGGSAGDAAGAGGAGMEPVGDDDPVCDLPEPDEFLPNTSVGGGGAQYAESDHFRIYGSASNVDAALNHLEAAHRCFVEDWCFRSPGLSVHSDDGPYYKFNVYGVSSLGGAGGVMRYDARAGISYLEVLSRALPDPRVTVHEFGHALTLTEYRWVDQTRTGAWWETVANWVADTYLTSRHCEEARNAFGVPTGGTIINLNRVIEQAHLMIVSDQNYYEAWPFLTYLTNNPDGYPGLGRMAVLDLFRNHPRNNETPLHVLERIAAPVSVQTILGRYWARMAYLDIGHPLAQQAFFSRRGSLSFANLDPAGSQTYQVKSNRRPAYGGANIIPLSGSGSVSVRVTNSGNGLQESDFTATLAVRAGNGSVRYVDLPDGAGQTTVGSGEEASLVVVNTPSTLYQYDAFRAGNPELVGLNYRVQITGAAPAD
jgi:hypothetical protein